MAKLEDILQSTIHTIIREGSGGVGLGVGASRNRGVPGYPVPPEMEAPRGSEELQEAAGMQPNPCEVRTTDEFDAWYMSVDPAATKIVNHLVGLLEEFGRNLGEPYSRSMLGSSKFGLRYLRHATGQYPLRIPYGFNSERQAVLIMGDNKKGQGDKAKHSDRFAKQADAIWEQYLWEHNKGLHIDSVQRKQGRLWEAVKREPEEEKHSGTFLAFKIPTSDAEKLVVESGELPEQLHITLFYKKGLTADQAQKIRDIADELIVWPMKITLGGIGRFTASPSSDGKDVIYSSVDSPDLMDFRDELIDRLSVEGIEPDRTHGYTPHVTLKYIDPGESFELERFEPKQIEISEFVFEPGDTVVQKSIPHLEDLKTEEFDRVISKLREGLVEISEKVDGSCRISFGVEKGKLWTESKYGSRKYSSAEYPDQQMYQALKAAHRALESKRPELLKHLPEGVNLTAEVLFGPIPNSIPYGPNAIIVHGVQGMDESSCVEAIWDVGRPEGWILEYKRLIDPRPILPLAEGKRDEVLGRLVKHVRERRSFYGGGDVEGLVLREVDTGRMYKLVDKKFFTRYNKFLWEYRERLDKGIKIEDRWHPGVMQKLRNEIADNVLALPVAKTPGFVSYLTRHAGSDVRWLGETPEKRADQLLAKILEYGTIKQVDFLKKAACVVEQVRKDLNELKSSWVGIRGAQTKMDFLDESNNVYKSRIMPEEVKKRTDEAFRFTETTLEGIAKGIQLIGEQMSDPMTQRVALTKLVMGNRYQKLVEALSGPTVGVTIGRYQPFHAGHAAIIRHLANSKYTKVIVFVAGRKQDPKNPFNHELREQMIRLSLPDVGSKVEIYPAEIGGKPSGYVPGLIQSLVDQGAIDTTAEVQVLVGGDRLQDFQKQIANNKLHQNEEGYFKGVLHVQDLPAVQNDDDVGRISGTKVREAIKIADMEKVKAYLDPHLVGDPEFPNIFSRMRAEVLAQGMVESVIVELGGGETGMGWTRGGSFGSTPVSRAWLADENDEDALAIMVQRNTDRMVPFTHGHPNSNLPGVDPLESNDSELGDSVAEAITSIISRGLDEAECRKPVEALDGKKRSRPV